MLNHVLDSKRIESLAPAAAAGTTLTSSVVDMQEFDSVVFGVRVGALTTGQTLGVISVNAGNAANGSDMAALAGASITVADADTGKWEYIEVVKPVNFRYVELVFTRNTQAAAVVATTTELQIAGKKPTSDDATTIAQTMVVIDPEYVNSQITVVSTTYPGSTTKIVNSSRTQS